MSGEPDLLIVVGALGEGLDVVFTSGGRSVHVPLALSASQLDDWRQQLTDGLERFLTNIPNDVTVPVVWPAVSEAMHVLHKLGRGLAYQLFQQDVSRVASLLLETVPGWRRNGMAGARVPLVEIRSRAGNLLPFEFLPLLDRSKPPVINSPDALMQCAGRFLGFSAIVYRTLVTPSRDGDTARAVVESPDNLPALRVKLFHHAGLDAAVKERQFFERAEWIDLRGPWPSDLLRPSQAVEELAQHLWFASLKPDGTGTPDQIHHFACHCNTQSEKSYEYMLDVADRWNPFQKLNVANALGVARNRQISLGELQEEMGSYPDPRPGKARPLVFLNACGTSHFTSKGAASFPEQLLGMGNCGFIGTESRIQDAFAAAFSKRFYLYLVRGNSVGAALQAAKWSLLKHRYNPLGILYTLFGKPDLQVRPALPNATAPLDDFQDNADA